jgi:hypothetical protein
MTVQRWYTGGVIKKAWNRRRRRFAMKTLDTAQSAFEHGII